MEKDKLQADLNEILASGINNTARVMELLKDKGYTLDEIMRITYQLLLLGKLDPKGTTTPYRAN